MANITEPNRTNKGNENYSFRCADAGFTGCSGSEGFQSGQRASAGRTTWPRAAQSDLN
jgi:hypothetical protein